MGVDERPAPVTTRPPGAVTIRLRLFDRPEQEIARALSPPWPQWMRRLYELEQIPIPGALDMRRGATVDVETTLSAAISAVSARLKHRLDLVAWAVAATADLGWTFALDGDGIVAAAPHGDAEVAWSELERAGVAGVLTNLCELDARGRPRMGPAA